MFGSLLCDSSTSMSTTIQAKTGSKIFKIFW